MAELAITGSRMLGRPAGISVKFEIIIELVSNLFLRKSRSDRSVSRVRIFRYCFLKSMHERFTASFCVCRRCAGRTLFSSEITSSCAKSDFWSIEFFVERSRLEPRPLFMIEVSSCLREN